MPSIETAASIKHERAHPRPVAPVGHSVGTAGRRRLVDGRRNRCPVHRMGPARIIIFDRPFLLLRLGERDIEVKIEVAAMRRCPGDRPFRALFVCLELEGPEASTHAPVGSRGWPRSWSLADRWMSACDGVGSPEGWLCTKPTEATVIEPAFDLSLIDGT